MENRFQEALNYISSFLSQIRGRGNGKSNTFIKIAESLITLQELIDKTIICGLSLDEAIPVIEMYKQLKYTTHQTGPIDDLMMGQKGQYYICGVSIQELIDNYSKTLDIKNDEDKNIYIMRLENSYREHIKKIETLEKALDMACEKMFFARLFDGMTPRKIKEYFIKESEKQ